MKRPDFKCLERIINIVLKNADKSLSEIEDLIYFDNLIDTSIEQSENSCQNCGVKDCDIDRCCEWQPQK